MAHVKIGVFLMIICLVLDLITAENAEARRRVFGRRNRGQVAARQNRNRNRVSRNIASHNFGNRFDDRINVNDPFALGRVPADIRSSLTLDPTGSVQRLAIAPNIGVNRNGQFFELNGDDSFQVRQPLAFSNGQFFGGRRFRVTGDTERQMQLVNETGNFDTLPAP